MTSNDCLPAPVSQASKPSGKHSAPLAHLVDAWLTAHPGVQRVLDRLQKRAVDGTVLTKDLIRLVKKWSDTLPPRRGVVKNLRDFMQLELALNPSLPRKSRDRRGSQKRGRRTRL